MSFVPTPVILNSPSTPTPPSRIPSPTSSQPTSSPSGSPAYNGRGLLIPTDRYRDELEGTWLPRLGRLRVEREVVLQGYSLYALRPWYLSRTHWSHTIVTYTGKPTEHITAYLILPAPDLSEQVGTLELETAIQFLANETHSQQKKTEYGTLLITSPAGYGQDVSPVAGGDFREARPYIIVNTALRRLGCGGRAAMGMESPLPPIRRKFHELYRIPTPATHSPIARTESPSSPSHSGQLPNITGSPIKSPTTAVYAYANHPILTDPFTIILLELVKLIQCALGIWGMYGASRERLDIDGLFCDETKAGVFQWRREIGMEHEESLKLEKETSGGCIDPKTLAALLSSITSTRYQLAQLGVEKLPKDPFTSIRRFLSTWDSWQGTACRRQSPYLSESAIHTLRAQFLSERTKHPSDALKVHRIFLSGVAQATSSISLNLKGGVAEDGTPLRKREHHLRFKGVGDSGAESEGDPGFGSPSGGGFGSILAKGDIGNVAPPDIITTDLEAYTKGILKSREKDWDVMGARRVGELWSGHFGVFDKHGHQAIAHGHGHDWKRYGRKLVKPEHHVGMERSRTASKELKDDDGDDSGGGARGAFKEMTAKTGQALKGVGAFVGRKNTVYETSDSDVGPGPSNRSSVLARRKQNTVPTVIEPDVEEVDEILDRKVSGSPSPSWGGKHLDLPFGSNSKASFLSATSRANSKRPSIVTTLSHDGSDRSTFGGTSLQPSTDRRSFRTDQWDSSLGNGNQPASERAMVWRERGTNAVFLRTASDGADVVVEDNGLEWEVVRGHGTGKGQREKVSAGMVDTVVLKRRHSLQDRLAYQDMRVSSPEHLAIDVEMASIVLDLRDRERKLAERARQMKILENSVFQASSYIINAIRNRRAHLQSLDETAASLEEALQKTLEDSEDNRELMWANKKIQFYLSEDMSVGEIIEGMRELEREFEGIKERLEDRRKEVEEANMRKGSWWRFGF